MIDHLFNRSYFLWLSAIVVFFFIVNPNAALLQRVDNMNKAYISCVNNEDCSDVKALTEAREYYSLLGELYPHYGRGFEMEGMCHLLLKQDNLAIKNFQEAIKYNPKLFWVSFELGKAFYRKGEYAKALECFQKIIDQDNDTLFKESILSTLQQLPDKTRKLLMLGLIDFVYKIKSQSLQMAIGCLLHQGNLTQAESIISIGLNDQELNQDKFFTFAQGSLQDDNSKKQMLSWIDSIAYKKPAFHPWSYVFGPLNELKYQ